jgi:hypothetical protein
MPVASVQDSELTLLSLCMLPTSFVYCKQSMDNSVKRFNKLAENMDFRKKTGYGMTHTLHGNSHVHQVTYGHYLKQYVDMENQQTYLNYGEDTSMAIVKIS